ncbi:ankyrin repeat-containing protein [Elysia marginata]|uniref:Ankyrin repeat-containing protein n=1 Tax=Elysia marginata TaxID=1093978 RepID=A0AAV4F5N7_9GAST|nr:ankyrin repeat-containing protein [Elysia marginata]
MGNSSLSKACYNKEINDVKNLLASGTCSINGDVSGRDPPIIFCLCSYRKGDEEDKKSCEILKLLVGYGANVNIQVQTEWLTGVTAAIAAARRGYLRCLQFLVESGADLRIASHRGDTALIVASEEGGVDCVKYLTEHMSVPMLNLQNEHGKTALIVLAACGGKGSNYYICFQHIVKAGADLEIADNDGDTALTVALRHDFEKGAHFLLEKGALVNTVNHSGQTPLSLALTVSRTRAMSIKILQRGLDSTLSRLDQFSLHASIMKLGSKNVVRELVMNGFPPLDLLCQKYFSPHSFHKFCYLPPTHISPLAVAILSIQPDIAKYLIANRFFTRFDIVELCWDPKIRQSIQERTSSGDGPQSKERQCLVILDFLSRNPQSLRDLCLITVSLALSQDFARNPNHSPDSQKCKERWTPRPTFRERVDDLLIPPSMKRELLHQTSYSNVCCSSWSLINLAESE